MSDTKYWRVKEEVESILKEKSPIHYRDLIEHMKTPSDVFYAGIIIHELTINGRVGWDSRRNLRRLEEKASE